MMHEKYVSEMEQALLKVRYKNGAHAFVKGSALAGAAVLLAAVCLSVAMGLGERIVLASAVLLFMPGVLWYFYLAYREEERIKRIDAEVPDVLLLAASIPRGMGIENVIRLIASEKRGPLSEEFRIVQGQIEAGMPIREALKEIAERSCSKPLGRAAALIAGSLESGAEMGSIFREAASDFMETNSILRERGASTAISKYTLLGAGGIIVPLILGLVRSMVSGLDLAAASGLGIGVSQQRAVEISRAAGLGSTIYMAEYAVLAAAFAAFQEGRPNRAVLYAAFLLPAGLLVYFIAGGL